MKLNLIWKPASVAALVLLGGCMQKEKEFGLRDTALTACLENGADTRVSLDSDGKFSWNTGDKLAVFVGTDYVRNIEVEPSTGRISVNGERSRYAVYPSDAADSDYSGNPTLKVNLPDSYDVRDIVAGGDVSDPYRRSDDWAPVPMVAVNDPLTDILLFRHVGGLLRIKWVGVPAGARTVAVTFDKDVTGSYEVDLTDTSAPSIVTSGSSTTRNRVIFTVSDDGLSSGETVFLSVPVPCGHYGQVALSAFGSASPGPSDTPLSTLTYLDGTDVSLVFARHWGRVLVTDGSFTYHLEGLQDVTVEYMGGGPELAHSFVSYKADSEHRMPVPFVLEYSATGADGTWDAANKPDWFSLDANSDLSGSTRGTILRANITAQENQAVDRHALDLKDPALHPHQGTAAEPFDLSTVNVATGETVASSSANCYVVQAPGYYKFPLVYGNTLKKGSYNQSANVSSKSGTPGEWRFDDYRVYPALGEEEVSTSIERYWADHLTATNHPHSHYYIGYYRDHLDKPIVLGKPSTINNLPNSVRYDNFQHYIAHRFAGKTLTARIVWTDAPGLVTDVAIAGTDTGAYMTFQVPEENICQGNAMLAVLVDGVIAWSWHIWVTDCDLTDRKTGSNNYEFAPVNIGWCDPKDVQLYPERKVYVRARQTDADGYASAPVLVTSKAGRIISLGGNSPYFQWGRKDPLQAACIRTMVTEEGTSVLPAEKEYYYHADYSEEHVSAGEWVSLGTAIQHPHLFYVYSGPDPHGGNWTTSWIINLWNSLINGYGPAYSDVAVLKTIYDPSPVGYSIPPRGAYSGFNDSSLLPGTDAEGTPGRYYGGTIFLPEAGYRNSAPQFDYARYWSANMENIAGDYRNGYNLSFTDYHVYPFGDAGTYCAIPVRPVKDTQF